MQDDTTIQTRLAIVERDVSAINNLYDKLDTSIGKLTEVASAIKELIAVHENKFENQQNTLNYIFRDLSAFKTEIENFKDDYDTLKVELNHQLDTVHESLRIMSYIKYIGFGVFTLLGYMFSFFGDIRDLIKVLFHD